MALATAGLCLLWLLGLAGTAKAAAVPPYVGVEIHSFADGAPRGRLHADLDAARRAGANVIRVDIGWNSLQTRGPRDRERWYVHALNGLMSAASRRGLRVDAVLEGTPCWASSAPRSLKQGCRGDWWDRGVELYAPRRAKYYATFVRWFTAHYAPHLAAIEIWNEPDAWGQYWKAPNQARAYAELVRAAYPAAKQGNPTVPVLAGSLAGSDVYFMEGLYRWGIRGYYDGLAIHPYCKPQSPTAPVYQGETPRWTFTHGIQWIRRLQLREHDSTSLWLTEFGWSSGDGWAEVPADQQAAYTSKSLRLAGGMPFVAAAIVYDLRDDGSDPSNWEDNFGLLTTSGARKPAFDAFAGTVGAAG